MILMNNFSAEPLDLRDGMVKAARQVIESGWYVLGKEVINFEKKWADLCRLNYGIAVGNGMDAIEITLRTLDIGLGDEVITTPMTAFATVLAIIRAGATPVLADIDPLTGLLCLNSAKRCLSTKTKAILLVHLYGQLRDMSSWVNLCKEKNIFLLEDCAQAHLASWDDSIAGSFGVAGAYSFYPTKNLGAVGDAGMIVTNQELLSEKARSLRNYGQSVRYEHPELGMNSRMDEIQAAILSVRLKWLKIFTERRREIAELYYKNINNFSLNLLARPQQAKSHVYHLFVLTCKTRYELQRHLKENGVETLIHYPVPIHKQKPCLNIKRDQNGLEYSESHANQCLTLPCHPQMSDKEIQIVIEAINNYN